VWLTTTLCILLDYKDYIIDGKVTNPFEMVTTLNVYRGLDSYVGRIVIKNLSFRIGNRNQFYIFKVCNSLPFCNWFSVPFVFAYKKNKHEFSFSNYDE